MTEIEEMKRLNENAFRIMRERANSERGITPKKEHCGYVFLGAEQVDFNDEVVWKCRFQMPYPVQLDYKTVSNIFFEKKCDEYGEVSISRECEFSRVFWGLKILSRINTGFKYAQNVRTGFWEVIIMSYDAPNVPGEMFPPKKRLKIKKNP